MTESEEAILRDRLLDEELSKPLEYFKHDTNAHEDEKILDLVDEGGLAWYGLYWLLVEHLVGRKSHCYDLNKPNDCHRLIANMNALAPVDGGEVEKFIRRCADIGLIDGVAYKEYNRIAIGRIFDNAQIAAHSRASRRLGGIKSRRGQNSSASSSASS